jgi:hypothetical protein
MSDLNTLSLSGLLNALDVRLQKVGSCSRQPIIWKDSIQRCVASGRMDVDTEDDADELEEQILRDEALAISRR